MALTRGRAVGVALVAALACAGDERSPAQTVERYLDALARDPVRSLTLVSDDFQRRHGMRFDLVGQAPPRSIHFEGSAEPEWGEAGRASAADPALELERARLGWLTTLTRRVYARQVPEIALDELTESRAGDAARVRTRARYAGQTASLDFALVRDKPSAAWRIDAIEVENEAALAPPLPYLVAPTAARHRRVEEMLSRSKAP